VPEMTLHKIMAKNVLAFYGRVFWIRSYMF